MSALASTVVLRQVAKKRPAEGGGAFRSFSSWGLFLWTEVEEESE
jgi:hypothetical protein